MSYLLEVKNLRVSFATSTKVTTLIENVTFSFRRGKVLAIVGESGSGKTLLARALTNLFPASWGLRVEGTVYFEGHNLISRDLPEIEEIRRHKIRYIFQDASSSLNPVATIRSQMLNAFDSNSDSEEILLNTLNTVGLQDGQALLDHYPHQVSVGTAQRIAIAMALLPSPVLIIADEPTSAVDVVLRSRILELFQSMQRDKDLSMILITHDLQLAEKVADSILVLYHGRVIESGRRDTFFQKPLHPYSKAFLQALPGPDKSLDQHTLHLPERAIEIPVEGCRFSTRCPNAQEPCFQIEPVLEHTPEGREVRCYYWK